MIRIITSILILVLVTSCTKKSEKIPEKVLHVLEISGHNRPELEKVIHEFQSKHDTLKLKAAYFLIGNMQDKGYAEFEVSDADNNIISFRALDYANYN